MKTGNQMVSEATTKNPIKLKWRIVVDTAENHAFSFDNIKSDAAQHGRPIQVECVRRCLGRHPNSLGDYSLEPTEVQPTLQTGCWCYVERKSLEDCQSTLLGFGDGHRERFESELANLAAVIRAGGAALVVVECSLSALIGTTVTQSQKPPAVVTKSLHRSVVSCWEKYGVPWAFCDGRRMAEITTFRFLESFWRHRKREARVEQ